MMIIMNSTLNKLDQSCSIYVNYQAVMVPKILTSANKVDYKSRLKALNEQHSNYQILELLDPESMDLLSDNYLSQLLHEIDSSASDVQEQLKELKVACEISEDFAPSSYQYSGHISAADLDSTSSPVAALKLLSKCQSSTCKTIASYTNYIFLYGIKEIGRFGLLNDPQLEKAVAAPRVKLKEKEVVSWKDKDDIGILNDINCLYHHLAEQNQKVNITITSQERLALLISSKHYEFLEPVIPKLIETFPKLSIVKVSELAKSKSENLALVLLQNSDGAPCFVSNNPSFSLSAFNKTDEPDGIEKYQWEITGQSPVLKLLHPTFIARMVGI